jgi:pimeloyl-ACP methyl ester carboxylesterase
MIARMRERVLIEGGHGRRLEVEVAGPDGGMTVIVHTGTPSSGMLYPPAVAEGAERGLRHIAYARPGYASSDRHRGRTVADCARDVAAIADALEVERFFTLGSSGGGPHALACAALLPERVCAAASIAGVAPRDAAGLDWFAGMGKENVDEVAAAEAGEDALQAYLERQADDLGEARGEELAGPLESLLSEVDRAALTGGYAEHMAASMRAALAPGIWGWFDDDVAHFRDWGFDLGEVGVPVTIWQGGQDRFVPPGHGEWLAAHVSGARAQLRPEHGHLSLSLAAYGQILDGLLASA